jgi:DnaJ-class molecular chaperone
MVKEFQQRTVKAGCLACNGSLNSYDSYFCPVCQGTGFVEVQAFEEVLLPKAASKAEILTPEEVPIPQTGSTADNYFFVEHL